MQLRPYDLHGNLSGPGSISGLQSGGAISRLNRPIRGMIRILLADDHAVVRSGIRNAMQNLADLEAVAEAGQDGAVPSAAG